MEERLDIGDAVRAAKEGKAFQRIGWNGKGLKVRAEFPNHEDKMNLPYLYIEYPNDNKHTPNGRCPWLASQTDILAEDYVILD